jgi:hypothetical protein
VSRPIRRLNDRGRDAFRAWLDSGAGGAPPLSLLEDPTTSVSLRLSIPRPEKLYERRYELGLELVELLDDLDIAAFQADAGLWDWLSLCLIDQICPVREGGRRKVLNVANYLLESNKYSRRNRHLIRTNWSVVRVHGAAARFILSGPLYEHGEAVEQLTASQDVITSRPLIAAIASLVWDDAKATFKRGFGSKTGPGGARRVPVFAKQFRLTYDLDSLRAEQILDLLPREFDRFRDGVPPSDGRRPRLRVKGDRRERTSVGSHPSTI